MNGISPIEAAQTLVEHGLATEKLAVVSAGVSVLYSLATSEAEFMAWLGQVAAGRELVSIAQLLRSVAKKVPIPTQKGSVVDWRGELHLVVRQTGRETYRADLAEFGIVGRGKSKSEAQKALIANISKAVARLWKSYSTHQLGSNTGETILVNVTARLSQG